MRAIGKRRSAALILSAILNLPKPLHRANWAEHTRQLYNTVSGVAKEVFREATLRAKLLHLKQDTDGATPGPSPTQLEETTVDLPTSVDVSWKSRYQSHHGMVAAKSADTGEVLDCHYACVSCP